MKRKDVHQDRVNRDWYRCWRWLHPQYCSNFVTLNMYWWPLCPERQWNRHWNLPMAYNLHSECFRRDANYSPNRFAYSNSTEPSVGAVELWRQRLNASLLQYSCHWPDIDYHRILFDRISRCHFEIDLHPAAVHTICWPAAHMDVLVADKFAVDMLAMDSLPIAYCTWTSDNCFVRLDVSHTENSEAVAGTAVSAAVRRTHSDHSPGLLGYFPEFVAMMLQLRNSRWNLWIDSVSLNMMEMDINGWFRHMQINIFYLLLNLQDSSTYLIWSWQSRIISSFLFANLNQYGIFYLLISVRIFT